MRRIGEQVVIDQWRDQWAQSHLATSYVSGETQMHMETYVHTGVAVARLRWTRGEDAPPGEVTMDEGDPGFDQGGVADTWHAAAGGHGGDLLWTWIDDRVRPTYNWARWYPELAPGRYEIRAYVPDRYSTASRARLGGSGTSIYQEATLDVQIAGGAHQATRRRYRS